MTRKFIRICVAVLTGAALVFAQDDNAHKITIKNLKYDPAKLTIKAGESVLWINDDDNDHTVTSDEKGEKDKPLFDSENLGRGDKFRHTFEQAGKFPYHCQYHPRMKAIVIVTE